MKKAILFVVLISFLGIIGACKKYPEDGGLSSKTVKGRLVGTWIFQKQSTATMSITPEGDNYIYLRFERNGEASQEFNYVDSVFTDIDTSGVIYYNWEFSDNKDNLILTELGSGNDVSLRILKLTKNSFVFEDQSLVRHEYTKNSN